MLGFNAYFLIEVLHEALIINLTDQEIEDFVDLINIHYKHGNCSTKIDVEQMHVAKIKEDLLANEILNLYHIYRNSMIDLISIYDIDIDDVLDSYDSMYEVPREELGFIDYIQAHRWFSAAIDFHLGLIPRVKSYEQFFRVNEDNTLAEYLTMSEVEKLAGLITADFVKIIENQHNIKLNSKIELSDIEYVIKELKPVP